jgi:hypothetical protein
MNGMIKLQPCSISIVFLISAPAHLLLRLYDSNKPVPWDYVKEIHVSLNNACVPDE